MFENNRNSLFFGVIILTAWLGFYFSTFGSDVVPRPVKFEFYYRIGPPSASDTRSFEIKGEFEAEKKTLTIDYKSKIGDSIKRDCQRTLNAEDYELFLKTAQRTRIRLNDEYLTGDSYGNVMIFFADNAKFSGPPENLDEWLHIIESLEN